MLMLLLITIALATIKCDNFNTLSAKIGKDLRSV